MATVEVAKTKRVTSVKGAVVNDDKCICLELENGENKFLNLSVFIKKKESLRECINRYQSLKGKLVSLYCWDPSNYPGKWSEKGWFKDVKVCSEIESVEEHIQQKGYCGICNIADGQLSYSEDNGENWFHYRCFFPIKK